MTLGLLPLLRHTTAVVFAAGVAFAAPLAQAQTPERLALVLGTTVYQGQKLAAVRDDTAAVSRKLLASGFDVIRREDAAVKDLDPMRRAAPFMVLYFSGQVSRTADDILLLAPESAGAEAGWPLLATLRHLRQTGAARVVAVVENCHLGQATPDAQGADVALAAPVSAPAATAAALDLPDLPPGIFVAMTGQPGQPCATGADDPRLTQQLLAALSDANADAATLLTAAAGSGFVINTFAPGAALGLAPVAAARPAAVVQTGSPVTMERVAPISDTVQIVSVSPAAGQVIAPLGQTTPIIQAGAAGAPTPAAGALRIIDVSPQSLQAAVPTPAGLPRPSIIVGEIRPQNASFSPTEDGGALTGTGLDATGFEAREQIRGADPELYQKLVGDGAFDPDAATLPAALQTALQRMGCYTARIDGDWGNGSRAAVDRYYAARGDAAPTREATVDLFRSIVLREDVVCPVVAQAAAAAPRAATGGTAARATNRAPAAAATPRVAPAQPAAPATNRPRTISPGALGSGVFR